jgi:mRNA interferase RelE/StbE
MREGFRVEIPNRVRKEIRDLPDDMLQRVLVEIQALQINPLPQGVKKLRDRPEYRIRVGDYRVLYEVDFNARILEIVAVLHRKSVYD